MRHIFLVTFPFFALVLCGYLAVRRRLLPLDAVAGLNIFVLFFALPCMLFKFASSTPIVRLLDPTVSMTYLAAALLMVTIIILATRGGRIGWNDAAFGALVGAFPNSGFMGVPLLVALFGPRAAAPVIVALAIDMVVTSSTCVALSRLDNAGGHGVRRAVGRGLRGMAVNPLPWAILLGCLAAATGIELPGPIMRTVEMLADGASPVALFTIGAVLARAQMSVTAKEKAPRAGDVPRVALYKLVLHPALVLAVGKVVQHAGAPLDDFSLTVLVLVAALPSASNVPMLAERFGADTARIARVVLLTTAAAFVTFSAAVAILM